MFLQAKAVETVPQNLTLIQPVLLAIPILQAPTIGTQAQPVTAMVPTEPVATTSEQFEQCLKFGALCTPVGRQCPNNYILPVYPEWSDPEEEKDF